MLLFAVLLPSLSPWGTIAYYQLNKDYIARVLCDNRSRPELHCDGQCYLAKKLKAQQEKQDKETTERVQKTPVLQLFCADYVPYRFAPAPVADQPTPQFVYTVGTYAAWPTPVFHPPGQAC